MLMLSISDRTALLDIIESDIVALLEVRYLQKKIGKQDSCR